MKILDNETVRRKIKRLSYEILENNYDSSHLLLLGINKNGDKLAHELKEVLESISDKTIQLGNIVVNPESPVQENIQCSVKQEEIEGNNIIIVDDVANTGRTLFYACKPLMDALPNRLETAVLVNRTHKNFPIKVDYVGLSLATTLHNHINVVFNKGKIEALLN